MKLGKNVMEVITICTSSVHKINPKWKGAVVQQYRTWYVVKISPRNYGSVHQIWDESVMVGKPSVFVLYAREFTNSINVKAGNNVT